MLSGIFFAIMDGSIIGIRDIGIRQIGSEDGHDFGHILFEEK